MKRKSDDILGEGFHDMEISDLRNHFLSGFSNSSHRKHLIERFEDFVRRVDAVEVDYELWIGGSFTTQKEKPSDIDAVFFVEEKEVNALNSDKQLELVHLFGKANKATIEIRYECDVYLALRSNSEEWEDWKRYFGTYDDDKTPKGIARITSSH